MVVCSGLHFQNNMINLQLLTPHPPHLKPGCVPLGDPDSLILLLAVDKSPDHPPTLLGEEGELERHGYHAHVGGLGGPAAHSVPVWVLGLVGLGLGVGGWVGLGLGFGGWVGVWLGWGCASGLGLGFGVGFWVSGLGVGFRGWVWVSGVGVG